jgi:hypothetical protein
MAGGKAGEHGQESAWSRQRPHRRAATSPADARAGEAERPPRVCPSCKSPYCDKPRTNKRPQSGAPSR